MPARNDSRRDSLLKGVTATLFWCAAFAFACVWYFSASKLLRGLPATAPVAIGKVTVEGISKARDYLGALLFYLLVPALTVLFANLGTRWHARLIRPIPLQRRPEIHVATVALFAVPFLLAPFFFLTTRKELWGLLLPPVLAAGAVRGVLFWQTKLELRRVFRTTSRPYHWLLLCEGFAWILFRYLVTGKRIAHIPTLFLEVVFVLFFLLVYWALVFLLARMVSLRFGRDTAESLESIAIGGIPLLVLPFAGLSLIPGVLIIVVIFPLAATTIAFALWRRIRWDSRKVQRLVAFFVIPALIFNLSYSSTAQLSEWIDLFHRGESLGPASDYLRGKVPYRDVFVLHGMLEDGLLDSWLMRLFGRRVEVGLARLVLVSSLMMPMLWLIAVLALDSLPLALLTTLLAYVISADNQRALPQLLVVMLLLVGIKHGKKAAIVLSGFFAGFAIFYSLDMGLYSVLGGLISLILLCWFAERSWVWLLHFGAGLLLGATPFLLYLLAKRAVLEFFRISFVTIPRVIDAVWSLPFPDLASAFRDFSLRTMADFVLTDRFRFMLNPLVLGIAIVWLLARFAWHKQPITPGEGVVMVLVVFAVLTQRSALGRADFQHQYFSAFLLPPILVLLLLRCGNWFRHAWYESDLGAKTLLGALLVLVLPVLFTILWVPDLLNARLDATVQYRPRISRIGFSDPKGIQYVDRIQAIESAVAEVTHRDDPVFDFSNQPALYFFINRPNPTRFYQIPILSPIRLQMETIRRLSQALPKVVFRRSPENYDAFDGLTNDLRAPAVAAFLDDRYAFERNVRGTELWRPVRSHARPLHEYRKAFVLPSSTSRSPRQRFVFPSVGSLRGAAGSHWQSDLILHNPHREPIRLRLRYIWGSSARDRDLRLPPGQTVILRDFARSFFAAPETRGALWVECPADRRPLARAATFELIRGGEPSIDPPLFETDAASADSTLNELTILGARGGGSVRVNLGVINVGPAPAFFRITTTTARGESVGVPAESLLQEDQSYLIVDAGRELGVPFDQPIVVHIRLLRGKAIGYASLVHRDSGNHEFIPAVPSYAP